MRTFQRQPKIHSRRGGQTNWLIPKRHCYKKTRSQTNTRLSFIDADFAGRWHATYAHLRDAVDSRTGYVLMFCGCLMLWASKLQSEIALSTTKAERMALSMSAREIFPLRATIQSIAASNFIKGLAITDPTSGTASLASTIIHGGIQSCLLLVQSNQMRPRTKHIAVKWWHFCDHVRAGTIKVVTILLTFSPNHSHASNLH